MPKRIHIRPYAMSDYSKPFNNDNNKDSNDDNMFNIAATQV